MKNIVLKLQKSLFIATLILAVACSQPIEKIVIISTNDIHAAIDQFPRLATLVKQYRDIDSSRVMLVDAGDRWTGNPYVDLAEPKCYPIIELMNTLGYDLATMGNHEFDYGLGLLAARMSDANFQKVLANIDPHDSQMPPVKPYLFRTIGGIKIGFVGLVTTAVDGHPEGKTENFGTTTFTNALDCAAQYASFKDSCDLLVGLTHIGYNADSVLATKEQVFDIIIGGHSHTVVDQRVKVGKTLITQTGKNLKYAGITTITVQGGKILEVQNSLIKLDTIAPSPRYTEMVKRYKNNPILQQPIGETAVAMDKIALLNLMSDIMLEGTQAQIALFNIGSVRIDTLAKGPIKIADVYAIEPFGNSPYIVEMSLEQIKTIILNKFNGAGKESHTLDIYPSGLSYQIVTDADGTGTDVFFKPYTTPSKKVFKVAMSDYMHSTYKFEKQGTGTPSGLMITELMIEYMDKNSPINVANNSRVEIK